MFFKQIKQTYYLYIILYIFYRNRQLSPVTCHLNCHLENLVNIHVIFEVQYLWLYLLNLDKLYIYHMQNFMGYTILCSISEYDSVLGRSGSVPLQNPVLVCLFCFRVFLITLYKRNIGLKQHNIIIFCEIYYKKQYNILKFGQFLAEL